MPSLNSLVSAPGSQTPPDVQGASGTDQPGNGLQSVMQSQGGQWQGPSHAETVAMLQHLSFFRRGWSQILQNPEIGKQNVSSEVYDLMSDAMADDYATLPEVMGLIKTMPMTPLEQRKWIEGHVQKDEQAMAAVLQHYASTRSPPGSYEQEQASADSQMQNMDRNGLVRGAVGNYKKMPKKQQRGIPVRA